MRLKKLIFICIFILFVFISINTEQLLAYDFGSGFGSGSSIGSPINVEKGFFDPLVQIYNKLIQLTKNTIDSNMKEVVRSATKLLATMAFVAWIVIVLKSWITGSYFFSELTIKTGLFLGLAILLNFNWYNKYILSNLEALFNNLPTVFNGGGGSVIANIINQTSSIANKIWWL